MAETSNNIASTGPTGPTGGPAVQPRIGPWLLMYPFCGSTLTQFIPSPRPLSGSEPRSSMI